MKNIFKKKIKKKNLFESGLNLDILGDWYVYDKNLDLLCNVMRRSSQLLITVKKEKFKNISPELLLEFEHLIAVLHNYTAYMLNNCGIDCEIIDVKKIDMELILQKYGGFWK